MEVEESEECAVLGDVVTVEMCVELVDLTGDTSVTAMCALELLTEAHPPIEIGPVEVEDATAGTVYLLHTGCVHRVDVTGETVTPCGVLDCVHHIPFVQLTCDRHLSKGGSSPVLQPHGLCNISHIKVPLTMIKIQ